METIKTTKLQQSKLDSAMKKLATSGIRLSTAVSRSRLVGLSVVSFAAGTFLAGDEALRWFSPQYADYVPSCGGNSHSNVVLGLFLTIGGLLGLVMTRNAVEEIIAGDDGLTIARRLGGVRKVHWHEIQHLFVLADGLIVLRLKSGGYLFLPQVHLSHLQTLNLLTSLIGIKTIRLSKDQPSLSSAFVDLKSQLVGPGVRFPVGQPIVHEMANRAEKYLWGVPLGAILLAVLGTMTGAGPGLGLVALGVGAVAWFAEKTGPHTYDDVVLRRSHLEVNHFGAGKQELPLSEIRSVRALDWHSGYVVGLDKKKCMGIELDSNSLVLLADMIKCAKSMSGLRVVEARKVG
jgi:hypothetical protein